jgi:hypothetical protein
MNIADRDNGIQACINAGVPLALTKLAYEKTVKENAYTVRSISEAFRIISFSKTGLQACVKAGAPRALIFLLREKVGAVYSIASTLRIFALSDIGRRACLDADAPSALKLFLKGCAGVAEAFKAITGTDINL